MKNLIGSFLVTITAFSSMSLANGISSYRSNYTFMASVPEANVVDQFDKGVGINCLSNRTFQRCDTYFQTNIEQLNLHLNRVGGEVLTLAEIEEKIVEANRNYDKAKNMALLLYIALIPQFKAERLSEEIQELSHPFQLLLLSEKYDIPILDSKKFYAAIAQAHEAFVSGKDEPEFRERVAAYRKKMALKREGQKP